MLQAMVPSLVPHAEEVSCLTSWAGEVFPHVLQGFHTSQLGDGGLAGFHQICIYLCVYKYLYIYII